MSQKVSPTPGRSRGGFIPKRFEIIVFSFLLSLFMSLLVSGVSTLRTLGLEREVLSVWPLNFASSWVVAFPAVLLVAPLVRKVTARLLKL